jgi:hypothetical protein
MLGPVVLFWPSLLALLVFGALAVRLGVVPLSYTQVVLLALGFSAIAWQGWLIIMLWMGFAHLRQRAGANWTPAAFGGAQILLVVLTIASIASLIACIPLGLLGEPNMQITGNGSYGKSLHWFADHSDGLLPFGGVFSLPMWIYQMLMLAFALWLAFSLWRWLKIAWLAFNTDGRWKTIWPKRTPVVAAQPQPAVPAVDAAQTSSPPPSVSENPS